MEASPEPEPTPPPPAEAETPVDLKSCPEVAGIYSYCQIFSESLGIEDFAPEELEEALLDTGGDPLVRRLHIILLEGMTSKRATEKNWPEHLKTVMNRHMHHTLNPLRSLDYHRLPVLTKVGILLDLCEWNMEVNPQVQKQIAREVDTMRIQPIGFDKAGNKYWYLGESTASGRLYRETALEEPQSFSSAPRFKERKGTWEAVTTSLEELQEFIKPLETSEDTKEKDLWKKIKEDILPEVERLMPDALLIRKKRQKEKKDLLLKAIQEKNAEEALDEDGQPLYLRRGMRSRKSVSYSYNEYDASINDAIDETEGGRPRRSGSFGFGPRQLSRAERLARRQSMGEFSEDGYSRYFDEFGSDDGEGITAEGFEGEPPTGERDQHLRKRKMRLRDSEDDDYFEDSPPPDDDDDYCEQDDDDEDYYEGDEVVRRHSTREERVRDREMRAERATRNDWATRAASRVRVRQPRPPPGGMEGMGFDDSNGPWAEDGADPQDPQQQLESDAALAEALQRQEDERASGPRPARRPPRRPRASPDDEYAGPRARTRGGRAFASRPRRSYAEDTTPPLDGPEAGSVAGESAAAGHVAHEPRARTRGGMATRPRAPRRSYAEMDAGEELPDDDEEAAVAQAVAYQQAAGDASLAAEGVAGGGGGVVVEGDVVPLEGAEGHEEVVFAAAQPPRGAGRQRKAPAKKRRRRSDEDEDGDDWQGEESDDDYSRRRKRTARGTTRPVYREVEEDDPFDEDEPEEYAPAPRRKRRYSPPPQEVIDVELPPVEDGACQFCKATADGGNMLRCSGPGCRVSSHTYCCQPPLRATALLEPWYCKTCTARGNFSEPGVQRQQQLQQQEQRSYPEYNPSGWSQRAHPSQGGHMYELPRGGSRANDQYAERQPAARHFSGPRQYPPGLSPADLPPAITGQLPGTYGLPRPGGSGVGVPSIISRTPPGAGYGGSAGASPYRSPAPASSYGAGSLPAASAYGGSPAAAYGGSHGYGVTVPDSRVFSTAAADLSPTKMYGAGGGAAQQQQQQQRQWTANDYAAMQARASAAQQQSHYQLPAPGAPRGLPDGVSGRGFLDMAALPGRPPQQQGMYSGAPLGSST